MEIVDIKVRLSIMENNIIIRPAKRYLIKLYLKAILPGIFIIGIGIAIFSNIFQPGDFNFPFGIVISIAVVVQIMMWVIATIYYRTIIYEIHSDEVIVRSGIFTRTVKHVPFRTITNITTTRDLLDQLTGLGSLSIQTAGSGSVLPEEKLAGVTDLTNLYEFVARELRKFRNTMTPTQSESTGSVPNEGRVLIAILQELRAIRQEMNKA